MKVYDWLSGAKQLAVALSAVYNLKNCFEDDPSLFYNCIFLHLKCL